MRMGLLWGGWSLLEEDLQSELGVEGLAWADGWVTEVWSDGGADRSALAGGGKSDRSQIGVVEEVVHVGLELDLHPFGDRGRLYCREIERFISGVRVLSTASGRVGSGIWINECIGIKPLNRTVDDGVVDAVWILQDLYCTVCAIPVAAYV